MIELRLLDIQRMNMQNIRIMVIVNINRRLAMIDISIKPKLDLGGAPTPTKNVLKIKTLHFFITKVILNFIFF